MATPEVIPELEAKSLPELYRIITQSYDPTYPDYYPPEDIKELKGLTTKLQGEARQGNGMKNFLFAVAVGGAGLSNLFHDGEEPDLRLTGPGIEFVHDYSGNRNTNMLHHMFKTAKFGENAFVGLYAGTVSPRYYFIVRPVESMQRRYNVTEEFLLSLQRWKGELSITGYFKDPKTIECYREAARPLKEPIKIEMGAGRIKRARVMLEMASGRAAQAVSHLNSNIGTKSC